MYHLETEEVYTLIQKAQSGEEAAKEKLVSENAGLLWSIVKRFKGRGYEMEDLYQIGAIGLLKCIEKFDVSMEVKFSTYAVPMIMGEIKRFLRDDGMIKVSRPLKELAIKAKYTRQALIHKTGREVTIGELAQELSVSVEELAAAMDADREVESIYATVYQGDNGNSPMYVLDKLEQKRGENDDKLIERIALKEILNQLEPKERQIILLRYFEDKTQSDIAKRMGISQVQVSRIEKKVLMRIRQKMEQI
ncbi:MAG TPA: RNA polymerase sporulation sigma factor, SigF/SigG family [Candidatus Coprocola pullicola]|nr:RNA polymerase sporulation sigma factor, SigF/SigG family [Candidatus Coprocola pullicola]